jgi:hypothetical protein
MVPDHKERVEIFNEVSCSLPLSLCLELSPSRRQADTDGDGLINFAEFFLIGHGLESYYIADPQTADKKAREGSQSRDDYLRTKYPFLSRLKNFFDFNFTHEPVIGSRANQHEMVDQQFEEKESEDNEGGEEGQEEEAAEVIDEKNVEDKVREYEPGSRPPPVLV